MSNLRFRKPASQIEVQHDKAGRPLCRYCSLPVPPWRQTFCSRECIHFWKLESDGVYLRKVLFERDSGICFFCTVDCVERRRQKIKKPKDCFLRSEWEVHHHLRPVCMGGGVGKLGGHEPGDLSDVVTACRECHAVQTKELAEARFAEGRKKRCALILSVLRANKGVGLTSKHLTWVLLRSKSPVLEDLKLLREKKFISRLKTGYYEISESGEHTLEKVEAQTRKAAGES